MEEESAVHYVAIHPISETHSQNPTVFNMENVGQSEPMLFNDMHHNYDYFLYGDKLVTDADHTPLAQNHSTIGGAFKDEETCWKFMNRHMEAVGIFGFSSHDLRHAASTHMVRAGASIEAVQFFLGHKHIQSTEIYVRADQSQAKKVIDSIDLEEEAKKENENDEKNLNE